MNAYLILAAAFCLGLALVTWAWGAVWQDRAMRAEAEAIPLSTEIERLTAERDSLRREVAPLRFRMSAREFEAACRDAARVARPLIAPEQMEAAE